jgi:SP family xylose:H+ symportor-like MFS transporter
MAELSTRFNYRYVIGISFISALGGYLFGFDFAVIAGALPFLRTTFHLSSWWEGFLTGSLALGCIVGSHPREKRGDQPVDYCVGYIGHQPYQLHAGR